MPPRLLRSLDAIDATRVHQTRSRVVSFSNSRPFGPSRATATPRAGAVRDELVRAHSSKKMVARFEDGDSIRKSRMSGCENDAWESRWPWHVVVARDEDETSPGR